MLDYVQLEKQATALFKSFTKQDLEDWLAFDGLRMKHLFIFRGDFIDIELVSGILPDETMSKYGLPLERGKWKIDKSFINLPDLENKLNVKFKIIENA